MNKELLKQYFQNSLDAKNSMLQSNSLSEEDKALLENQVAAITDIIAKLDESENDVTAEQLEEVKNSVNELNEKLTALNERINLNKNNEDKEQPEMEDTLKNYLESKNAIHDFAEAIRNSKNADEFKNNWDAALKNAADETITIEQGSEEAYLPAVVKGMINDIWDRNADWLKDLNYTGAKRFFCRYNDSDQNAETSRAKGYKKGTQKAKQVLDLSSKLLEAQFIYKIATVSLQTRFEDDGALIAYVVKELTDQILFEIKRAILVGDGRQANDDYKINKIEAIAKTTTDAWTNVIEVGDAGTDFLVDDMRLMVDSVNNPNNKPIYVFMSKADLRTLSRVSASETSTPVYVGKEVVAEQLGCDRIITTDLLGDDFKAVAMIPDEYYMVGATNLLNPILYTWHEGWTNTDCYRNETVVGGGINGLQSTAVLHAR